MNLKGSTDANTAPPLPEGHTKAAKTVAKKQGPLAGNRLADVQPKFLPVNFRSPRGMKMTRLAEKMRAVVIHRFGGPGVLQVEEVMPPLPSNGQFLIEVEAASVNPVDHKIRTGTYKMFRPKLPAIIGRDIAGTIHTVGPNLKGSFKVGDSVFGMLDYPRGAYARYTVATARELACRPGKLSVNDAGALGVAALTAWQGLFDHGHLKRGQRVLIHGAAGGVAHLAVQFAKWRRAYVIATAGKA